MVLVDQWVLAFLFHRLIPGALVDLADPDFLLDPVVLDRLVDPLVLAVLLSQKVLGLLKDPKDQQDQDDLEVLGFLLGHCLQVSHSHQLVQLDPRVRVVLSVPLNLDRLCLQLVRMAQHRLVDL